MPKHYRYPIEMRTLVRLRGVHSEKLCRGEVCVIHNPTQHHMRTWPLLWRNDRMFFERVCEHGVGHPDPDHYPHWEATGRLAESIHGCDRCCIETERKGDRHVDQ